MLLFPFTDEGDEESDDSDADQTVSDVIDEKTEIIPTEVDEIGSVSYTHLTLPTTPYV